MCTLDKPERNHTTALNHLLIPYVLYFFSVQVIIFLVAKLLKHINDNKHIVCWKIPTYLPLTNQQNHIKLQETHVVHMLPIVLLFLLRPL